VLTGATDAPNPANAFAFPPKDTNNFAFLNGALGALAEAIDGGADAAPSLDARAGYAALMPKLDAALMKWNALKANDLPALNAMLKATGEKPITLAPPTA
ncbi:MAG: hypothetical protein ACRERT_00320, partial [Pseudomonas sp.]